MDAATDFSTDASVRPPILSAYRHVRGFSATLAGPLSPEDMTVQSMADASPTKWHLAHTSWFFETFILKALHPGYTVFDPAYEFLFNSYYNGIGPQFSRPDRGVLSRPTVAEIFKYRAHVDEAMRDFIENCSARNWASARPLIALGLNHEQQHQELILTDLKHAMSFNPLYPAVYPHAAIQRAAPEPVEKDWIEFEGGLCEIGWSGKSFAFDNEGPAHEVLLRPFRLAPRPVTNAAFIDFIAAGGYTPRRLDASDLLDRARRRVARIHTRRTATARSGRIRLSHQFLRGIRIRRMGGRTLADGVRMGDRIAQRASRRAFRRLRRFPSARGVAGTGTAPDVRRHLGMDAEFLRALSGLSSRCRRGRRI
jgi:DinB superfamily/Sulfatase-modifying factor enzyme 1